MGDDIDNLDRLNFELQSLKQSQTKEDKQKVNTLTIEYDRKILEAIHNLPKSNTIQGQHNKDNPYNRMLWIDDYPANNKSIMDVYRRLYVEIDIALDTKQTLDYLNKKNYDLIISDIGRFGELDAGIKMISEIKNTKPENLQTQIIPPIFIRSLA